MLAALQFIVKYVLILGTILGLVFMVTCTALVIICAVRGDIKISIIRCEDEKENG